MYIINETKNGQASASNLVGLGGIVGRKNAGADRAYFAKNGHGDVTKVVGADGSILADYDYDAYGNQKQAQEPSFDNPFRYASEYTGAESGNIYLRARYYDTSTGRFLSEDTHWNPGNMIYGDNEATINNKDDNKVKNKHNKWISEKLDSLKSNEIKVPNNDSIRQSKNLYSYALNNPTKYIDPQGKMAVAAAFNIMTQYGPQIINIANQIGVSLYNLAAMLSQVSVDTIVYLVQSGKDAVQNFVNNHGGNNGLGPNLNKISDRYLKKQGMEAHDIKYEYLGKGAKISKFDLYADKNTGQIYIVEKATKKIVEATWYYIK